MKLFIVAALIAFTSAARLENLERSYLPPDNNSIQGGFGTNGFGPNGALNGFKKGISGNGFNNGLGANGFGVNGRRPNGFAVAGQTPNGNGVFSASGSAVPISDAIGPNAFATNIAAPNGAFAGATNNQYLPPNQGPAGPGLNGFNSGRSAFKPASRFISPQFNQGQAGIPGATYGVPQFGATINTPNGSAFATASGTPTDSDAPSDSTLGAPTGNFGAAPAGPQAVNRQYLAPNAATQNPPQQPFDDRAGYIY